MTIVTSNDVIYKYFICLHCPRTYVRGRLQEFKKDEKYQRKLSSFQEVYALFALLLMLPLLLLEKKPI